MKYGIFHLNFFPSLLSFLKKILNDYKIFFYSFDEGKESVEQLLQSKEYPEEICQVITNYK